MTLALFPRDSFFATLPQLFTRLSARAGSSALSTARARKSSAAGAPHVQNAIEFVAAPAVSVMVVAKNSLKTQRSTPLRILRVVELGDRSAGAGRMRMSGSMADVCAELDRLVERESRQRARLH